MSRPPMMTTPPSCASSPAITRNSVVLPQPEGPSRQRNSPLRTLRLIWSSTSAAPKRLLTPSMRNQSACGDARSCADKGKSVCFILLPLFRLGLAVVALVPLSQDAVTLARRPFQILLDQQRFIVGGNGGMRLGHAGISDDGEVFRKQLIGRARRRPIGQLARGFLVLAALEDGGRFDVPAQALLRQHHVQRRTALFQLGGAIFERDPDRELAGRRLLARFGTGVRVLGDVLVQLVHEGPAFFFAEQRQPRRHVEV